jgi:hypothetical protein
MSDPWEQLRRLRRRERINRHTRIYLPLYCALAAGALLWWGVNWQAAVASFLLATAVIGKIRA